MSLRITGGELGGRRIAAPGRGEETRPTSERVREAVFSILGDVSGAAVLDLFCGSGALAIEALSRGAASATLVDTRPRLAGENVARLGLSERARVVRAEASRFLRRAPSQGFDLILCDPPYELSDRSWTRLAPLIPPALAPGGRLMLETAATRPLEVAMPLLRERRYGDSLVRVHASEEAG